MAIIDTAYVTSNSINLGLCNEVVNNPSRVAKLIAMVEKKVLSYIDIDLIPVDENNTPIYPGEIKEVVLYLVESYYASYGKKGREFGMREKKSENIDDYSYSTEQVRESGLSPLYFFDIPITKDHLDMLNTYAKTHTFGFGYFDV